ncbi:GNAT family N-acetyltransferase [Pseudomonas stutzeri]|nr:GNAT family N-acetyltransferase [Stutzerimonas stutzeri]
MKSIYMDDRWEHLQATKEGGVAYRHIHESQGIRIVYPFIKRFAGTANGVDYYDLVSPRGVPGIWFEHDRPASPGEPEYREAAQAFQESLQAFCAQENVVAEFVRFSPWSDDHRILSATYSTRVYGTNYCNLLDRDFFHEDYSPRKQGKIRKMQREGVTISFGTDESYVDQFLRLYSHTQAKYNFTDYYKMDKESTLRYLETFPDEAIFAQANFEGKAIVSSLILLGQDIAHFHFSGADPEYHRLDANSLLLYESAVHAAERGRKMFDLGDALKGSPLEKFKQCSGKGYPYIVGTRIHDRAIYDRLVEQAGGPRENYFPAYRR